MTTAPSDLIPCPHCGAEYHEPAFLPHAKCSECEEHLLTSCVGIRGRRAPDDVDCPDRAYALAGEDHCAECFARMGETVDWPPQRELTAPVVRALA